MDPLPEEEKSKSSYGKRPLWQWILIYLVVAAVVYGLIYFFLINPSALQGPSSSIYGPAPTP